MTTPKKLGTMSVTPGLFFLIALLLTGVTPLLAAEQKPLYGGTLIMSDFVDEPNIGYPPKMLRPPAARQGDITGNVALFFYCLHIAILGVFSKRIDLFYREGEVATPLIGVIIMMIVMLRLSKWFYKVKSSSKNIIIKMM